MRPRFSLRTLFILMTLAAAALVVLVALPTWHARRFAAAINSHDYATAAKILDIAANSGTAPWNQGDYDLVAILQNWTPTELFIGRRRVSVHIRTDEAGKKSIVAAFVYGFTPLGLMH